MSLNLAWLGLGGQTVKNLLWLVCKFDLDQSEGKSSQVNASAHKDWPNGVASRLRLARASSFIYKKLKLHTELKWAIIISISLSSRACCSGGTEPRLKRVIEISPRISAEVQIHSAMLWIPTNYQDLAVNAPWFIPGVSNWTKLTQNSIEPNPTPTVWLRTFARKFSSR